MNKMTKTTQVIALGSMLVVTLAAPMSAYAAATSIDATAVPSATTFTGGDTGTLNGFNDSTFTFTQSANVALNVDGDTSTVGVSSASTKGMHTFGGNSMGGSVKACETTSVSGPTPKTVSLTDPDCANW
jgi:hypothetical protein